MTTADKPQVFACLPPCKNVGKRPNCAIWRGDKDGFAAAYCSEKCLRKVQP